MALTREDLQAISELLDVKFDQKLQPIKKEIVELKEDMSNVKEEIAGLKEDMSGVKTEIAELKEDMSNVKTEIAGLKKEIAGLKEDMSGVKTEIAELKEDMSNVKTEIGRLNDRTAGVIIHLENVTDRGIKIIGEGHADLTRKLDEALKIENEKEILLLRMNYLEGELQMVKKRLSELEKTA